MTTAVQRRRGTSTEHASFTGLDGEITVNTTTYTIHVHDGTTVGGIVLAKADGSNISTSSIDINGGTIDGTVIGGSSAAAGSFTTITASGEITANGGIALGDNDKATFGASDDLQIYHDGSNSYISDTGTGNLNILANEFALYEGNGTDLMIGATPNGAVTLSYNASTKLATTATGVDVTGTVTADGLTVDGLTTVYGSGNGVTSDLNGEIYLGNTATYQGRISYDGATGSTGFYIDNTYDSANAITQFRMRTNGTDVKALTITGGGDISFYNSAGSSQSLFWDASAESLGIGTSSPLSKLDVRGGNLYVDGGGISGSAQVLASFSASSGANFGQISNTGTRWSLGYGGTLSTVGTEVLSWNSSGNVGIGTTSPSYNLVVSAGGASGIEFGPAYSGTANLIQHYNRSGAAHVDVVNDAAQHRFRTSGTERMRIDSSGNLLVGDTTASIANEMAYILNDGRVGIGAASTTPLIVNRKTNDGSIIELRKDQVIVGSISVTSSSTAYNTSSDERLKENIVDAPAGNIDAIKVRSFDWKANGEHQDYGMVAQELEAVAPYAVTKGETEDDMWSVDYSKLVPMLIKEIQDLKAEVAALKGA